MTISWQPDEQYRVKAEHEEADEWCEEQATRVYASAGESGPWGVLHPVAWGYATGRLTAGSVGEWRQRFDGDPAGVGRTLATLAPLLGPQGPQVIQAAAGVATIVPPVDASLPRPRGSRNAVDELRESSPGLIEAANRGGPPPEMFPGSGDQPRATASGIEVAAISALPWRARLAAAWAPDRVEAFKISQDYGGADADAMSRRELGGHRAVVDYVNQVEHWARTSGVNMSEPMTPEQVAALYPPKPGGSA